MKKTRLSSALLAGALLIPTSVPALAESADTSATDAPRYLYMVRNVKFTGEIYTGRFTVIRKSGDRVTGAYGMFYSEARCLKGRVRDHWLTGRLPGFSYGGDWIPAVRIAAPWRGSGRRQHMKGWTPVTLTEMSALSGGGVGPSTVADICGAL